ncbi:MAG: hypothetical protein GTN78_15790, partial [Gemmatimonadales bacterium]|nr:hypothetical protein [Gemmatimonadales bacterium]
MDPGFSVSQAPESAQDEAYELEIRPEGAYVRARALPGMRWGLATLRQVLQATPQGATMPAASLLDWPTMGTRGMFLENKWGPDL